MNDPASRPPQTAPDAAVAPAVPADELPTSEAALVRGRIDRSCRTVCLLFFAAAVFWLIAGSLFALIASFKLHNPELMTKSAWSTFGRVRPAHLNTVIYGWAAQAGLGVLMWLFCRLCRTPMRRRWLPLTAAMLWNIGVTGGTAAILSGGQTGFEWLEFPTWAALPLFLAFGLVSIWAVLTFADRTEPHVYVSQWYLFGAIFWFPWLYSTVQILLLMHPMQGVPQAVTQWWFAHNVLGLFFTPIGLAAVYYLIPKVIGRPVHSYHLSMLGFWSLALFYSWAGAHHLIGGPVPAWVQTASIVASVMMFVPVVTVAINHHMTMRRHFALLRWSPTLRFAVFGAMAYTVVSVQGSLMAVRWYNEPTHFTHHTIGHAHLGMYGFFTMVMFGSLYYIVPRLTGREWAGKGLIRVHFWCAAAGIILMFVALSAGGAIQGLELNQADKPLRTYVAEHGLFPGLVEWTRNFQARSGAVSFQDVMEGTSPWLHARSVSGVLLTVAHLAFAWLLLANLRGKGAATGRPTLLRDDEAGYRRLVGGQAAAEGAA